MTEREPRDDGTADTLSPRLVGVLLVAVTLLGAVLRLYRLGHESLWFDEAVMWWISEGSWSEVWSRNATYNSAPPTFALLLHGLLHFADGEAALRAIAWVGGVASIPAAYALGRAVVGRDWALFVAFLVAVSPQQIRYSQEVREYSLAFLLATLLLLAFLRFLERPDWRRAGWLAAATCAAVFLQYGLAVLVASLGVAYLVLRIGRRQPRHGLLPWTAVQVAGGLAAGAVYAGSLRHHLAADVTGRSYLAGGVWDGSVHSLVELVLRTPRVIEFAFPSALFVFAVALGGWVLLRGETTRSAGVLLAAAVPVLVTLLLAVLGAFPFLPTRHSMHLMPMFFVLGGLGVARLAEWRPAAAALAVVILTGYGGSGSAELLVGRDREHFRPVVAGLEARAEPTDVVYAPGWVHPSARYYLRHSGLPLRRASRDDPAAVARQLEAVLNRDRTGWLLTSRGSRHTHRAILDQLDDAWDLTRVESAPGASLYRIRPRRNTGRIRNRVTPDPARAVSTAGFLWSVDPAGSASDGLEVIDNQVDDRQERVPLG